MTRAARMLSLAAYLALIAVVMAWIVFLGDVEKSRISLYLVLFVTPLLIPLRGVLHGRDKALVWGALVALPYAVHGGVVAWSGPARWLGLSEAGLSLVYLISASLFIRWRAVAHGA
ncbi:MAG: DUF2069 domain-containing protein [Chromatiaceae bacterium]|nr:DUF2069 domain-containing protein [Gammaproteobacteria bacterium]MCP5303967.1 DUF2069 domain-containing protein [Chromatiaceae bacterium]MCP5313694.1 DUF2069 domain-containing protein [Chromatiaceae bacterium]